MLLTYVPLCTKLNNNTLTRVVPKLLPVAEMPLIHTSSCIYPTPAALSKLYMKAVKP